MYQTCFFTSKEYHLYMTYTATCKFKHVYRATGRRIEAEVISRTQTDAIEKQNQQKTMKRHFKQSKHFCACP